jgi:hypothetical protein
MINWLPYPSAPGEYATMGDLVLSAYPDGSWTVYNRKGGQSAGSEFAPIMGPFTLEEAKQKSVEAANQFNLPWE